MTNDGQLRQCPGAVRSHEPHGRGPVMNDRDDEKVGTTSGYPVAGQGRGRSEALCRGWRAGYDMVHCRGAGGPTVRQAGHARVCRRAEATAIRRTGRSPASHLLYFWLSGVLNPHTADGCCHCAVARCRGGGGGLRSGRVKSNGKKVQKKAENLRENCSRIAVPQPNLPKPQRATLLHRRLRIFLCPFKPGPWVS